MITRKQIIEDITETYDQCYGFEYKGKHCGIDPIEDYFVMWYGDTDYIARSLEAIFTVKLYDGKTLEEILPDIEEYGMR